MNLEEIKKYAEHVTAAAAGHTIQKRQLFGVVETDWEDMGPEEEFNSNFNYRVKPLPVLVPYSEIQDILGLVGKVVCVSAVSVERPTARLIITARLDNSTWHIQIAGDSGKYTPLTLMRKYEFLSGEPCGVYVDRVPKIAKKELPVDILEDEDEEEEEDDA